MKKGQLSYNHGNSKLAKFGTIFELEGYEEALVPRVYHSFTVKNHANPKFIELLFKTKLPDRELAKLVSSGARMDGLLNISYESFMDIRIRIPKIKEQNKVAQLLQRDVDLITHHQKKLDQLKQLKKWFLQNLFV